MIVIVLSQHDLKLHKNNDSYIGIPGEGDENIEKCTMSLSFLYIVHAYIEVRNLLMNNL